MCNICIDLKVMLESKNKLLRVRSREMREYGDLLKAKKRDIVHSRFHCVQLEYTRRMYSGIYKGPLDTKYKVFLEELSLKQVLQEVAIRWQSKTFHGNVAWRAGTTIGLLSLYITRTTLDIFYLHNKDYP